MSSQASPNIAAGLLAIHKVITRGLDVSMQHASTFNDSGFPDEATRTGFLNYIQALSSILHGHHSTEDELAFPYFRDLLPAMPVARLSAQHQEMIPLIETVTTDAAACRQDDTLQQGLAGLLPALSQISAIWHPHIRLEEEHFSLQTVGDLLSPEEHLRLEQQFGKHSQEHTGPPFLTIPFMLYNLPAETRLVLTRGMPAEVTSHLVPVVWKEQWISMLPFLLQP